MPDAPAPEAPTQYALGSLDRTVRVLTALEASPGARLTELSKSLGANATTLLRTLRVLEEHGLVRRGGNGGYTLGMRLVELGHAATLAINVVDELRAGLAELSRQYNVTAHVGMLRDNMITVVEKIDPPTPLVRYSTLGTRMPLHATAAGKSALALLDAVATPVDLDTLDLRGYTPATIASTDRLRDEVTTTRERRFAVEFGEYQVGFSCVGTAMEVDGDLYTMSLSGPQAEEPVLVERGGVLLRLADGFAERHASITRMIA